ncbi:MAG TPA: saccharopine dehydrogenase, partial [Solirubrobacteraceae bacterium]|nr:saccharopine dehydrogenase [Solirubrobacteraceae bacterium]
DVGDVASLHALAAATRVLITTVGPYTRYGEPVVRACAQAGTDYLDLTGEPAFVDAMWLRHHRTAQASGARLIHCAGFDSMPHDLGAQFTVEQLPEDVPITVEGYVRARVRPSGGTVHSAVGIVTDLRGAAQLARERRRADPDPPGRRVRALPPIPGRRPEVGWVLPMPTVDPQIVLHSARALPRYGPDFRYGHFYAPGSTAMALGATVAAGGVLAAAQLPPARRLILARSSPGEGPSAAQRARGWFNVRFAGEGGGQRVVCEVAGGDPGYGETAKMLGEAALCLAHDDLPSTAGQVTTAVAMGPALRERLLRAGISFARVA